MTATEPPKRRWFRHGRWLREFDAWRAAQPIPEWQLRDDAALDRLGEAYERAHMPCLDCEIGEPHICEPAYWCQQIAHYEGRECSDLDCVCHVAAELAREAAKLRPTSILNVRREVSRDA